MEKTEWLKVKVLEKGASLTDEQIFDNLYELIKETGFVKDEDVLKKDIMERENKGSTKLTPTLFVPHTKTEGVSHFCAAMLVIPGGNPGFKNLGAFEPLMKKVDEFVANDKYVAAICAAPTVFGHRGLLKDKNACCYPGMEGDLVGAKANENTVNIDGKIITSRGLGTAIDFSLAIISELIDQATADKIGASVVYGK